MLGDDVVDLFDSEALPGALHPRFDGRVFAAAERVALCTSGAPDRLRWILWAAKEAAYKAARRLDPRLVFSPSRFVVTLDADLSGHVEHASRRFALWVDADGKRVHAVAAATGVPLAAVRAGVVPLTGAPQEGGASAAARGLALRAAAALLGEPPEALAVLREHRMPQLVRRGRPAGLVLSLSHHGRFAAFALAPVPGSVLA
jgi:phosphopantetheinyl transferase (holo-ACP synthase)